MPVARFALLAAIALAAPLAAGCNQPNNNPFKNDNAKGDGTGPYSPTRIDPGESAEYRKSVDAGQKAIDARDYDLAISHLKRAVREKPDGFDGHFKLGWAYAAKNDHAEGVREYTEAIRIDPRSAAAFNNRGNIYSAQGNRSRAIEDYSESIRLDGNDATAYLNRAGQYESTGRPSDALRDYTKVIELNPAPKKKAEAYWQRAGVYRTLSDRPAYRADRERAMDLDPDYQTRTTAGDVKVVNNTGWAITVDVEYWTYPNGSRESFSFPFEYKFGPNQSAYLQYNGQWIEARDFDAKIRTSRGTKHYIWKYQRGATLYVTINNGDLP